jgi:hypothetical protein
MVEPSVQSGEWSCDTAAIFVKDAARSQGVSKDPNQPGEESAVRKNWSRWGWRFAAAILILNACGLAIAQFHRRNKAQRVPPSTSLTFMKRDGSCVTGPILKIEPKRITIQQPPSAPVAIERNDLLQASQGDALVFSARSSWADVENLHLRPNESFEVKLRSSVSINEKPLRVTADSLVYKRFLWWKKSYAKSQIVTVDYLRMKPDSNVFDYFTQEAPALLFFYPDSYDRLKGLEGRIPVRLYDAAMREDDAPLRCLSH